MNPSTKQKLRPHAERAAAIRKRQELLFIACICVGSGSMLGAVSMLEAGPSLAASIYGDRSEQAGMKWVQLGCHLSPSDDGRFLWLTIFNGFRGTLEKGTTINYLQKGNEIRPWKSHKIMRSVSSGGYVVETVPWEELRSSECFAWTMRSDQTIALAGG